MDSAIAPDRHSASAERVDSSSVLGEGRALEPGYPTGALEHPPQSVAPTAPAIEQFCYLSPSPSEC